MSSANETELTQTTLSDSFGAWRSDHTVTHDDATWILTGFGLLESGSVSVKNELNIMVKNAVDVIFGGLTYWAFGYAFSFGEEEPLSNPVIGWGDFFVTASEEKLGWIYSKFFFQASFATTATTIVSGAMAERTKLGSYMIFSMLNALIFSLPAHWVWATKGWLYTLGAVDIAGAGPVHLVGGLTGLVATLILKPRHSRYLKKREPEMSSPTNAVLGMFMLWWGWLGFNCGSTFGISGVKWKLAARSAATTLCSSVAGGTAGLLLSYSVRDRKFDVRYMINGLLGSLVSVTAICALAQPWEGLIIGSVGSLIANGSVELLNKLKIDDPVGCVGTHAMTGVWGLLAAGLFVREDSLLDALYLHNVHTGLFYGGGWRQLGIQALTVVSIAAYSIVTSFVFLKIIDCTIGLRVPLIEEIIGADIVEHGLGQVVYDRKSGRIICPDEDEEEGLSIVHARELKKLRHHSVSRVSHLLGHHVTNSEAEINSEIRESLKKRFRNRSTLLKRLKNCQVEEMDVSDNTEVNMPRCRSGSSKRENGHIPNGDVVSDTSLNTAGPNDIDQVVDFSVLRMPSGVTSAGDAILNNFERDYVPSISNNSSFCKSCARTNRSEFYPTSSRHSPNNCQPQTEMTYI